MDDNQYFKIRINTLIPDKPTSFDLYLKISDQQILYLRAGDSLNENKMAVMSLKDSGSHFYIREADRKNYRNYLHELMNSSSITTKQKAMMLRESSMNIIEELYEQPDISKALENSRPVIKAFISFMDSDPSAMADLISLSSHDFYTYNHSLDVAIYSLGLGEALGLRKAELEELGLGSLFHDIGKRQIPLEILTKKGGLDDAEWALMQKHPQFGLIILNNQMVSDAIKAACFEHHESWSGNGYPQQIAGEEIHPFGRIVAITDTYDAMTTQRSYNVPLNPIDAVMTMKEKIKGRYDPEMLKAMYSILFKLKAV